MRYKFIVCKVMQKEAYLCASRTQNTVDIVLMPQGLHNTPDILRTEVRRQLDMTCDLQGRQYDAVLLGYGLCCNGIIGLCANIPLVVPRCHDCITLLIGSKDKYRQYFDTHRGVYWYSAGWIDTQAMPCRSKFDQQFEQYRRKYGDQTAQYLMQTEQAWITEYNWAVYIDWDLAGSDRYIQFTKDCADFLGWKFDQLRGDPSLIQQLLEGNWNNSKFLVVKPGEKIAEDLTNPGIIKTQRCRAGTETQTQQDQDKSPGELTERI